MLHFMREVPKEEIDRMNRINKLLDFYEVPRDTFDDSDNNELYSPQRMLDYLTLIRIAENNEKVPKDLHERLTKYKEEDKQMNNGGK